MTAPVEQDADSGRAQTILPISHLLRISAYWLGLTAIDSVVSNVVQNRTNFGGLVEDPFAVGRSLAFVGLGGAIISIVVQPTVGYISDFTESRWGRRKPYIVVGSLLDVVFLLGIAYSNTLIALAAFVALLSISTNVARGPFQGYVPDLVHPRQVGLASALVGLMQILGNVVGFAIGSEAAVLHDLPMALIAVAIIELVTMLSVVLRVGRGLPPRSREGRSWLQIARDTWATDILQERSYVWLLISRFGVLVGGGILYNGVITYMHQTFRLDQTATNQTFQVILVLVVIANLLVIVPASRLSDRIGRKPVIYASCAIGAAALVITALAPTVEVAYVGAVLYGVSGGMFLSVDWALMTDIIPRASAGRYMGLSNVATGASTPVAVSLGGLLIDFVNTTAGLGTGPRVAFLSGAICYALGAAALRPVVEPRRARPVSAASQPAATT